MLRISPQMPDGVYGLAHALARLNELRDGLAVLDELHAAAGQSAREQMLRARILGKLTRPAMAAGISDHVWTRWEIAALLD